MTGTIRTRAPPRKKQRSSVVGDNRVPHDAIQIRRVLFIVSCRLTVKLAFGDGPGRHGSSRAFRRRRVRHRDDEGTVVQPPQSQQHGSRERTLEGRLARSIGAGRGERAPHFMRSAVFCIIHVVVRFVREKVQLLPCTRASSIVFTCSALFVEPLAEMQPQDEAAPSLPTKVARVPSGSNAHGSSADAAGQHEVSG